MSVGKNEGARRRLAAAMKKKPPTREEQIAARVAVLEGIRGRTTQADTEYHWLRQLQARDAVQAEIEAGAAELAELRAAHREASAQLAGMKGAREGLRGVEPDRLLEAAREQAAMFAELGALSEVANELARRIREAEQEQRARTAEFKRLNAAVIQAKAWSGLPAGR